MIRRDVRLADGQPGWMLISQLEHARVSAELARQVIARFPAGSEPSASDASALERVRREVLAAIQYHDDGWFQWEIEVPIDPARGVTPSFTELAAADAVEIWSASIATAEAIGPLAAWMVSGHFLRLAEKSHDAHPDSVVRAWRAQMESERARWIAEWGRLDSARHTHAIAEEALQWLWTFDEISLWLCCTCSAGQATIPCAPGPYCAGVGTPIETALRIRGDGVATADPWRHDAPEITVSIAGNLLPAAHYQTSSALLRASASHRLEWILRPNAEPG